MLIHYYNITYDTSGFEMCSYLQQTVTLNNIWRMIILHIKTTLMRGLNETQCKHKSVVFSIDYGWYSTGKPFVDFMFIQATSCYAYSLPQVVHV